MTDAAILLIGIGVILAAYWVFEDFVLWVIHGDDDETHG